jgi:hypothetical protein
MSAPTFNISLTGDFTISTEVESAGDLHITRMTITSALVSIEADKPQPELVSSLVNARSEYGPIKLAKVRIKEGPCGLVIFGDLLERHGLFSTWSIGTTLAFDTVKDFDLASRTFECRTLKHQVKIVTIAD